MLSLYYTQKENSTVFSKKFQINLKLFVDIHYKPIGNLGIKNRVKRQKPKFCRLTLISSNTIYGIYHFTPKYFCAFLNEISLTTSPKNSISSGYLPSSTKSPIISQTILLKYSCLG